MSMWELRDASGTRYPPRVVMRKLAWTVVLSTGLAASLWVVAAVWGLFH